MPPRVMTSAMSVGARPGRGGAPAADVGLEEQGHGLLDGGDGVAGGAGVTVEGAVEQSVPERVGVGVFSQDLGGFGGGSGFGDPPQQVIHAAPGEGGGVEVGLEHFGCFAGVEPCGVIPGAAVHGAFDSASGERFGSPFGDHRVNTPGDRVPQQFREPGGEAERVKHHAGPATGGAGGDGEQEVFGFGEGDQGGARCGEQGGGEGVEGFPGALGADDPGGAVPGHPELPAAGGLAGADFPPGVGGVESHRRAPLP